MQEAWGGAVLKVAGRKEVVGLECSMHGLMLQPQWVRAGETRTAAC